MKRTILFLALGLLAGVSGWGREITLKGSVNDAATGKPLKHVVVSDGVSCVTTNAFGNYRIKSDSKLVKTVFVVTPADYEITYNEIGMWNGWQTVDTCQNVASYDFTLTKRIVAADKYRMLMVGDPQQMSSRPHSARSVKYAAAGLAAYAKTVTDEHLYVTCLGDMVTNEIEVPGMAEAYFAAISNSNVNWFNIPGNHDHVLGATNYYDSIKEYARFFGPYNYAVNLGKIHFIYLDSVAWYSAGKYNECLNDEAVTFLENDLKFVPVDTPIMICTHCPLTKKCGGIIPQPENYDRMIQALQGREVNFWYGHVHFNTNYSYTPDELAKLAPGVKAIESHTVDRIGGNWACSGEVMRDGAPRGFVEVDIDGRDIKWEYVSIDPKYPSDFNVYVPGQFAGDKDQPSYDSSALYCNIYLWDNLWSTPEVWIDGKKVADFEKVTSKKFDSDFDPLYQHFFPMWAAKPVVGFRAVDCGTAKDNSHLFKVNLEGVNSCEIRFTDRFGKNYSRVVSW